MKLITLTLNPAFDIHCYTEDFQPYHENLADITDYEAGGKGVNISRALTANGVDNLAVVVLGEENGDSFARALKKDGLSVRALTVPGRIRENITLHTEGKAETRISFHGFSADEVLFQNVTALLDKELNAGDILTLTGRNPDGFPMDSLKAYLKDLQKAGIRVVIDSRSFSLNDLREVKPWLIKPNQEEISSYLGREIKSLDHVRKAALELHRDGIVNVMISMGGDGAFLLSDDGEHFCQAPKIEVISTVGAGDSSIAGFIAAAKDGKAPGDCLKSAVSYGSAACMRTGTRPPLPEDVRKVLAKLKQ